MKSRTSTRIWFPLLSLFGLLAILPTSPDARAGGSPEFRQTFVGTRSYLTSGGSVLFEAPLALEVTIDPGSQQVTERIISPPNLGAAQAEKMIHPNSDGTYSVRFKDMKEVGTAVLSADSSFDWNSPWSDCEDQRWTWKFKIPSHHQEATGGGRYQKNRITTFGQISTESGKSVDRFSENYWLVEESEFLRVKTAILAEEDPELIPPAESSFSNVGCNRR